MPHLMIDAIRRATFHPRLELLESRELLALFTVTNTLDNGAGSLRQAIINSNDNAGPDLIIFNIPGAGPHIIQPATNLPTIIDPVTIDGFTQPGAGPGNLKIELRGSPGVDRGLYVTAGMSLVRGLVINTFPSYAIRLEINGANRIEGNYLGTNVAGSIALGNGSGVSVDHGSSNNVWWHDGCSP